LIPHRVADFLDLRQCRRRDSHLEVLERRPQRRDVDDVVAELLRQLLEGVDAFPQSLLPVTHGDALRANQ
jgi:hypothetical protein